jgi:serine/threonine protein kinase
MSSCCVCFTHLGSGGHVKKKDPPVEMDSLAKKMRTLPSISQPMEMEREAPRETLVREEIPERVYDLYNEFPDLLPTLPIGPVAGQGTTGVVNRVGTKALKRVSYDQYAKEEITFLWYFTKSKKERSKYLLQLCDHFAALPLTQDGTLTSYIITEYLPGGTMDDRMDQMQYHRRKEGWPLIQKWVRQLVEAIYFLHEECLKEHAIVHQDIKANNIMFDKDDNIRLIDFGLAIKIRRKGPLLKKDVRKFGFKSLEKLPLWAPELLTNAPYTKVLDFYKQEKVYFRVCGLGVAEVSMPGRPVMVVDNYRRDYLDTRVDIWAIGCILMQFLVGTEHLGIGMAARWREGIPYGVNLNGALVDQPLMDLLCNTYQISNMRRWTIKDVVASEWFKGHALDSNQHTSS